ncbi:MAG TPA: hypothetical protein PLN19_04660 [Methanothrix sp.]|nr:hypothetical protein [Methanothrix sp.]HOV82510.1 hypothetical protein [Methanothrix sp.]HPC89808.1 hypothetical protein [Methanothrix sp.]HQE87549.1 hypothetical protein [Methanothrix sp.]HQI68140.1 hypothetical protein [Methanothrix sp.]
MTDEAVRLHDVAAGIIRSLLDRRGAMKRSGREFDGPGGREELIRHNVDDAMRWNNFMDELKTGGSSLPDGKTGISARDGASAVEG